MAGAGLARWQWRVAFQQAEGGLAQPAAVVGFGFAGHELAVDQERRVRVVLLEQVKAGSCQVGHAQALVRLDHQRQAVGHGWGFLEVFHHVATAVGGGDVGLALDIVVANVHFIGGQQVAQVHHAVLGVGRVAAVGVAAGQLGELVERVAGGAGIALGHVQRQEARHEAAVLVKRGQALEVVGVVDVRVLWVQADEALGGGLGGFRLHVLVVGIDQVQLRLFGVAAERVARLQGLELAHGAAVAAGVQVVLRLLVQFGFAEVFVDGVIGRTGGGESEDGDQQQVFHLHGGLRPCDGWLS